MANRKEPIVKAMLDTNKMNPPSITKQYSILTILFCDKTANAEQSIEAKKLKKVSAEQILKVFLAIIRMSSFHINTPRFSPYDLL